MVDVDALDRDAELAHRRECGVRGVRRGLDRVDVVEHDDRVLAAELERGADQAPARLLGDRAAGGRGPREADVVGDIRQRFAHLARRTGHDGPQRLGHAGVDVGATKGEDREGALVVGLLHHGAAGGERGHDVHGGEAQREVPGRDDPGDALGLVAHPGARDRGDARATRVTTQHPPGGEGVVTGDRRRLEDLFERLAAGLAALELDEVEEELATLDHEVVRAQQHPAALGEAGPRPGELREARTRHGVAHVVGARAGQLVQGLTGRRSRHGDGVGARRDDVVGQLLEQFGGGGGRAHGHSLGQLTHFAAG